MGLSVGEVLENANYNLSNSVMNIQVILGKEQLENYTIAKRLGADDEDDWDEWEDKVEEFKQNEDR